MRHGPGRVDRVARKAAADVIVDSAARHPMQRAERHLALATSQQEVDRRRRRELRGVAEAAVARVVGRAQVADRVRERLLADRLSGRLDACGCAERADHLGSLAADLLAPLLPRLCDREQQHPPAGQPVAGLGREVRAGVERLLLGRHERVQRPAAMAGHRLACLHADRVDVGTLLAVDLDRDEVLVHKLRDLAVLEGLALHHVAPVAGRVADRHQQRLVFCARARRAPPRPTGTSRPGCPCAGAGTGSSRLRGGLAQTSAYLSAPARNPA